MRFPKCHKCGGPGHHPRDCQATPTEVSCYKCAGKGHFARNCPTLNRDMCYFCGILGHHGVDCPLILRAFGGLAPSRRKELVHRLSAVTPQFTQNASALVQYAQHHHQHQQHISHHDAQYHAQPYAYSTMGVGGVGGGVGVQGNEANGSSSNTTSSALYASMQPSQSPHELLQQYLGAGNMMGELVAMGSGGYDPSMHGMDAMYGSMMPGPTPPAVCYRCGQPGHIARACMATDSSCFRCGGTGHLARECTNPPSVTAQSVLSSHSVETCFRCGERGHFSRDCTKNGATPSRDACFKCGQPGHKTRDCRGPDIRVCFLCKGTGHVARDCTNRPPPV